MRDGLPILHFVLSLSFIYDCRVGKEEQSLKDFKNVNVEWIDIAFLSKSHFEVNLILLFLLMK